MRRQLHLLELEIYRFVDAINELIYTCIYSGENRGLLVNLELELGEQVLVERVLRRLHLVEQLHDLSLARVRRLVRILRLLDNFICHFTISAHELVSHLLELLFFGLKLFLYILIPSFALHDDLSQEKPGVNVGFLKSTERIMRWFELNKFRDVRLIFERAWVMAIFHEAVSP